VNRHDGGVRRTFTALSCLLLIWFALGVPGTVGAANPGAVVRTIAGGLSAPSGIALDAGGDLFIADTNHCRVLMVAARDDNRYGRAIRNHHTYVLAGGHCGGRGSLGYPTGVAVDGRGDLYIAVASRQVVLVIRPTGRQVPVIVAGTGRAGFSGNGRLATMSELDQPTGVALDQAGDLFIADTSNCLVREIPADDTTAYGQAMSAHHLYSVVGTGVCGSSGRPGPMGLAQLWNPVAIAVDSAGDLVIADNGDQSVLEAAVRDGSYFGTPINGGDVAVIVGSGNGNGPYLNDGLSATGVGAELNDPEGVALGATGSLFVTDGSAHVIRVVPGISSLVLGRSMHGGDLYTLAGALPITTAAGLGNGTRWIGAHMDLPLGVAVTHSGGIDFSDAGSGVVREISE
jgi:hypothetical protein